MTPSNRRRCAAGLIVCALVLWAAPGWAQEAATLAHGSPASVGMDAGPLDEAVQLYRDAVARFGAEGPEVEPGSSYSYSNAGYNTLGAVIEVASGMPLEKFLRTRIYEPLGMFDTLTHEDETTLSRMATVYRGRRRSGRAVGR